MRYFMELAYNGASFFGWQIQPNQITVQEALQKAMSTILREDIQVVGAGRTDTGVHASFYVAHFDSENLDSFKQDFVFKLNRFISKDISIHRIYQVKDDAHARFDAVSRSYQYKITTVKDPFNYKLTHFVNRKLDLKAMNSAAATLLEYENFAAFERVGSDNKTSLCDVTEALWVQDGANYTFHVTANRFLRNMVRAIVGTLLEVGYGKLTKEQFRAIIESENRGEAGTSAPGQALFLTNVVYEN